MSSNTSTCHTEWSFHAVRACQILKVSVFGGLRSFCVLPRPEQPQSAINYTHSAEKLKFSSERSLTGFSSMCTSVRWLLDICISFVPCTCPPLPLFGTKTTQSQRVALKAPYNEVESSLLWRYKHTHTLTLSGMFAPLSYTFLISALPNVIISASINSMELHAPLLFSQRTPFQLPRQFIYSLTRQGKSRET